MMIPAGPDALTDAWLTTALRQWHGAEVTVTSVTAAPLAENKGFYGQVVRLTLAYHDNAPRLPQRMIAKFSSPNEEMRLRSVDSYQREVNFYQRLAPEAGLPVPDCYYATIDMESGKHLLLLQHLAPIASGSRIAGCTIDQARVAIHQIAKLHTRWWDRTEGDELTWLPDAGGLPDSEAMQAQYDQWWPRFYEQAQGEMSAEVAQLSQALGARRAFLRQHIFHAAPRTLIHRDYQLDNLFFVAPQQETEETTDLTTHFAIIDWQFLSRGRGIWDIAYFLSENLLPTDRRQVEMELLAEYHHLLVASGINDYPFEQLLYDYRLCLLQRHTALVSTIAAMPFSAEQRKIHINILLPRNLVALADHNAFALLL